MADPLTRLKLQRQAAAGRTAAEYVASPPLTTTTRDTQEDENDQRLPLGAVGQSPGVGQATVGQPTVGQSPLDTPIDPPPLDPPADQQPYNIDQVTTMVSAIFESAPVKETGRSLASSLTHHLVGHAQSLHALARDAASTLLAAPPKQHKDYGPPIDLRVKGSKVSAVTLSMSRIAKGPLGGYLQNGWYYNNRRQPGRKPTAFIAIRCSLCHTVYHSKGLACLNYPKLIVGKFSSKGNSEKRSPMRMNQALRSPDRILPSTEAQLYEHEYSVVNVDDAFLLDDLGGIIVLPAKLVCTNLRFIIIPQVESINNLEDLLACQSRILLNALETWLGLIDTVTQCSVSSAERSALNAYLPASTQAERERRQCIDSAVLAIRVKDGRKFRIILNDCELIPRLAHILGTIANPQNLNAIPAFEFCSPGYALGPPELENGSQLYDPIVEFTKFVNRSTLPLRLSSANVDFRVCPSYPEHFVVPAAVTDSWVVAVANFRSKGRVPMVSWVSQNGRCSLWRCSQPKSMFSRSPQDEQWLIQLRSHTSKTPSETRLLLIVDARRHINAVVNKATGAGFENINTHYQGCEIEFCGIGNIHTVSSCWAKQIAAINMITIPTYVLTGDIGKPMNDPIPDTCDQCGALHSWSSSDEAPSTTLALSERKPLLGCVGISNVLASSSQSGYSPSHKHLAQSWWYDEIQAILRGTNLIVSRLCCEESVLVHCSDGWDRTAQLTSLAMLLLDSYYRTLTGFMILIEQEFIYAGHPFHTRTGAPECVSDLLALDVVEDEGPSEPRHVSSKSHRSPVFIQWLDCVYQLMNQYPSAFEFNTSLLLVIAEHLYSCLFGTFLGNSQQERKSFPPSVSLWTAVLSHKERFINSSPMEPHDQPLFLSQEDIVIWYDYWFRYHPVGVSHLLKHY